MEDIGIGMTAHSDFPKSFPCVCLARIIFSSLEIAIQLQHVDVTKKNATCSRGPVKKIMNKTKLIQAAAYEVSHPDLEVFQDLRSSRELLTGHKIARAPSGNLAKPSCYPLKSGKVYHYT